PRSTLFPYTTLFRSVDREIDHHDRVLLDDSDQQKDADQRDQAELQAEHHEGEDRAHAGRGQRRQDGERVGVALIEDSEDQVDSYDRRENQDRLLADPLLGGPFGAL